MADLLPEEPPQTRRRFGELAALLLGTAVSVALLAPVLISLYDPLRRRKRGGSSALPRVKVAQVDEIPNLDAGAAPLRAPVVASSLHDAWNRLDSVKLGTVFLGQRAGVLTCLSATCPHAGCGIEFDERRRLFSCPCHNSTFATDGSHLDGPSPRGMDRLEVLTEGSTVYCLYQRFRLAVSSKVPV
jgi:Rieske Fe-S protein